MAAELTFGHILSVLKYIEINYPASWDIIKSFNNNDLKEYIKGNTWVSENDDDIINLFCSIGG